MNTITDDKLESLLGEVNYNDGFTTLNLELDNEFGHLLVECTYYDDGDFDHIIYVNNMITEHKLPMYQQKIIKDYINEQEDLEIDTDDLGHFNLKNHL